MSGRPTIPERVRRVLASSIEARGGPSSVRLRVDPEPGRAAWLATLLGRPCADAFHWREPAAGTSVLGLGAVRVVEARGPDRFADVARQARAVWRDLDLRGDAGPASAGPLLVGGFAFADEPAAAGPWTGFPAARLVLPELLFVEREGAAWLTLTAEDPAGLAVAAERAAPLFGAEEPAAAAASAGPCAAASGEGPEAGCAGPEYRVRSDRSHADYRDQVEQARRAIASGDLEKVVLARSLRVRHDGRFDVSGLMARLCRLYPRCVSFAISRPGLRFLGATPELLVARRGRRLQSAAVAGSAPRGRTPEEDADLGRGLRESKKEQEEHAIVVRALARTLGEVCDGLEVPEAPRLLRIEGIQHLETPIAGTLAGTPPPSLLELAGRLHPTPAVSGAPTEAALAWIDRCEGMDRGWYAGPVGFVDREGGGEMRVALRSGLVGSDAPGDTAWLYAGGGLVSDSDPERELEETRVKLRALLAPLTEI